MGRRVPIARALYEASALPRRARWRLAANRGRPVRPRFVAVEPSWYSY